MLRDLGSRDGEFIELIKEIRQRLLHLAHVIDKDYEAIIMQGSGTFGLENEISPHLSIGKPFAPSAIVMIRF
jgi:aspartate aminotransferase-like enzyme